jgi:hypothetical protein
MATDILSPSERRVRMRLIKSKNTCPELVVRKLCQELGHKGYRLHHNDSPLAVGISRFQAISIPCLYACSGDALRVHAVRRHDDQFKSYTNHILYD